MFAQQEDLDEARPESREKEKGKLNGGATQCRTRNFYWPDLFFFLRSSCGKRKKKH